MSSTELTNEERLNLISDMINQSKKNLAKGSSFYFIFWGWVVFVANITHFILKEFDLYDAPYIIWNITIPAGIISFIYSIKKRNAIKASSHIDKTISLLWVSLIIACATLLYFIGDVSTNINAIIMVFSALGTFLTGFLSKFKPLKWAGIVLFLSSIFAFSFDSRYQYLIGAIGILFGYLVPGYLLKKAESE